MNPRISTEAYNLKKKEEDGTKKKGKERERERERGTWCERGKREGVRRRSG